MADKKISDLTEDTAPTSDDLVETEHDPGGTPASRKATLANLTKGLSVMVGDSGSGGTKGLVPAPASGDAAAGKYLDAAGGFSVPPGTGLTTEQVQDIVGAMIVGGTDIDATYDDGAGTVTIDGSGGGGNAWTTVKKTADETKTADTTIATDAALTFSMLANTKYMVRARIYWNSTVAADFKWRHAGPASPTLLVVKWKSQAPGSGSVTDDVNETYSGSDNVISSLSAAHAGYIEIDAIIHNGVNAGAFAFQWAQNTSDAGNTIVYAGSWLEYQAV